ncbi:hypothetical protein CUZ56_01478 [Saezia sanguinis]|uniref:Uncharacterized protein n=1 Tax=Saezia sanguinis TaxID=1965230 RepID=A0A433SD64_9BURK|nr:hypothetical protein [Saezia sanguinis]RUS66688.1 hypothetical protein CUZ56_01478 [Saezia sanguinis]
MAWPEVGTILLGARDFCIIVCSVFIESALDSSSACSKKTKAVTISLKHTVIDCLSAVLMYQYVREDTFRSVV